jgi:ribosomal protein S12 methylthiotransferase
LQPVIHFPLKTKGFKRQKVNVITLGCSKNLVDSEVLMTQLSAGGVEVSHEAEDDRAGVIVINTCGFIENAKQESIDTILRYAEAKKEGLVEKVYVTGCLSQRYREDLQREIPEVDAWFGTMELPLLLRKFNIDYRHELLGERRTSTARHYAYLKISEGCDRPCSFCAIPLMRGAHHSRPIEELVAEARNLAAQGVRELLLIAQDSTYYGLDLYRKRNLPELLRRLSDVEGIRWIRLHYAYPSGFPEEILEVIAERDNICKYLDIPLQHSSDAVLSAMRRGITRRKTEALLEKIRATVPGIALRTTMLVGHPGETPEAFADLMAFIETWRFDRLGVFTYSHEEGTAAYQLADDIPQKEKEQRAALLMARQQEISLALNRQKIGRELPVLVDRIEAGRYVGRTEYDSPEVDNEVWIDSLEQYLRTGDFATVRIVDADEFDLWAVPAGKS